MSNDGQDDKNVNNDKENQKDTHDLQVLNDIGSIITQMTTNDPDELRRLVNQAQGLKSDNPRIQDIIESIQSIGKEKQKAAEERSNSAILQEYEKKLEEVEKQRQWEENEIRKSRLAINSKAYDELIKNGFHEELKQDTKLLEKASQDWDSLSKEDQKKISRHGLSKDEKAKLEEEDRQKSAKINLAHQLEEDAKKTKKFSQAIIDENTKKYGDNPTKIPTDIKKANDDHRQVIADCNEVIKKVQPVHIERENQRKVLLEIAKQNPKIVEEQVKLHHRNYKSKYEQLKHDDPNHRGSDELNKLIELCGGHEKLGLDKPINSTTTESKSAVYKSADKIKQALNRYEDAAGGREVKDDSSGKSKDPTSHDKPPEEQNRQIKTFTERKREKASKSRT